MTLFIGSIENEINFIRAYWRETKHESESLKRYYKLIDQPTHVKDSWTKKIIPFDNCFGYHSDHLNEPFVHWNGFYIQPFKVQYLNELINDQKLFYNGKIVTEINEIKDYIFAYKKGFESGYKHFDNIEIENKSSVFKSENLSIEKINNFVEYKKNIAKTGFTFTFFSKGKIREYCPFRSNYKENKYWGKDDSKPTIIASCKCSKMPGYSDPIKAPCYHCPLLALPDLKKWEQKGFENGKYYRAWFIILSNFKIFDEYFKSIQTPQPTGKPQQESSKPETTIDMIALKYVYEGLTITRENGNEIAKQYGHNSGEKLFQRFTFFLSTANRKGKPTPCTPKTLKNKIEKIEKVISLLPENKKQKAKDEVIILKRIFESEYQ